MFKGFRSILIAVLVLCFVPLVLASPLINITSPLNQTYININNVTFNVTLNETGACNYSLDYGLTNITMNSDDNLTFYYTNTSMSDGDYNVTFYCVNITDEVSSTIASFTVDTTAPSIVINNPTGTIYNNATILVNITSDGNTTWFYNGTDNQTYSTETYITFSEGINNLYAWANDTAGNQNEANITFMVDTTAPTFDNLVNRSILNNESLYYDINATDTGVGVDCYTINDTTNFQIDCTGLLENITPLTNGVYYIDITVNDTLGNTRTESININVTESDLIAPTITINSPTNTSYNNATILVNISVNDIHPDKIWYNYNGTDYIYSTETEIDFSEGINTLHVWANDTIGNLNYQNVTFIVDTTAPVITDNSGLNASNYNTIQTINITIIDANNFNATLYVNGSAVNTSTGTNTTTLMYTLTDGNYTYYVAAIDDAGNINITDNVTGIFIDTINPEITFISPNSSGTTIYVSDITFNVTATDTNIQNITFYLYDNTYTLINITWGISNVDIGVINLSDGIYYYNATAYDIVGNINITETYNITINTTIPIIYYEPSTDNAQFVNRSYIQINVTTLNINVTNLTITLYDYSMAFVNSTSTNETTLSIIFSDLAEGLYYFNATADDGLGTNISVETRNITIDITTPTIIFNPDTDNTILTNRNYIIINVSVNDTNLNYTEINIYDINYTLINTTIDTYLNYTVPTDGTYYYNATTYDLAGHTNNTETRNITTDTTAPSITINNPITMVTNQDYVEFNITIADNHIGNTTLYIYNSTFNLINITISNSTELFINMTELAEDIYYYEITSLDALGNNNSTITYNITIDLTAPSINIITPTNTIYNNATQLLNMTSNGDNIWFYNGTDNQTYTTPINITFNEGINNIYAWANDTAGNQNYTNITFFVDTTNPTITFNTPTNSSITSTTADNVFNITATDANIQNITFYLYDNASTLIYNITNISNIYTTITLTDGTYYYNATAYDSLGHINTTETRNITISITTYTPPPSGGGRSSSSSNTGTSNSGYYPPTNNTNTNKSVTVTSYFLNLQKGQHNISINRTGTIITLVTMEISDNISTSTNVQITTQPNNPSNKLINATIYKYILFNTTIASDHVTEINFQFRVEKTWIIQNNLTKQNMTIYQYNNDKKSWDDTPLSKFDEDNEYVYYASNSTKFTTLALGSPPIRYIESIKTENNNAPETLLNKNVTVSNTVATIKHKSVFQGIDNFFSNAWQNIVIFATNLSPDIQSLIIITMSSIFILIIGVVSGVLVYRNTIKPRRMRRLFNKNIITGNRILPYEEEPPKTPTPEVIPPVEPIKAEKPKTDNSKTPDPEFCVRKISELLLQCEYALDNGKIDEAKDDYANARNMYFNSGLSYEEKSRVYNKIIELYARFNKKSK